MLERPATVFDAASAFTPAAISQLDTAAQPATVRLVSSPVSAGYTLGSAGVGFGAIKGFPGRTAAVLTGNTGTPGADAMTTASIASVDYGIRKDLSLFGAHRIRFGKIKSGLRISSLIRKAAVAGPDIICVNQCAALATELTRKGAGTVDQLRAVSRSVNHLVRYETDAQMHGRLDQWSTPNETLRRGAGDCEDYAILKMALLAGAGVPLSSMEIVVVKDTRRRLFHAVLSVSVNGNSYILDNMTDAVETDVAKRDYAPLFSISGTANYVFGYKSGQNQKLASLSEILSVAPGAGF
ncbi:transglutaminase-like cysteine peptidase [Hoeflea ulvae]|uniref:Transglutaminase-like cysteine peptidase n=1 Tax=Hoeflea ulvae TaxID=2983764 RepID=A0ABT3YCP1_9HYPH|nr:transglutaminase-like cysteine peptidase [Hoeflea ulvae]MCY0093655.1 transglutaminase-like cysteine peptidase [Hoeflea ulvae]